MHNDTIENNNCIFKYQYYHIEELHLILLLLHV